MRRELPRSGNVLGTGNGLLETRQKRVTAKLGRKRRNVRRREAGDTIVTCHICVPQTTFK